MASRSLWFLGGVGREAPLVGFTGPRDLSGRWSPLVGSVVQSVVASGRGVAVGDARGADALVRFRAGQCGVQPLVFVPVLFGGRRCAGSLAHRSAAMVRAVEASGGAVVGFVSSSCPVHPRSGKPLLPSVSSSRCFGGFGSGTWATLAFAAGLGLPVVVFLCGVGRSALPSGWGGSWVPAGPAGPWVQGWRFVARRLV